MEVDIYWAESRFNNVTWSLLSRRKKEKIYSTKDTMSKTKFHVTFGSREVGIIQKHPIIRGGFRGAKGASAPPSKFFTYMLLLL